MKTWTKAEITKLEKANRNRPNWMTDYELAGRLASSFGKSSEAIRWQLRQMRRDVTNEIPSPKILLLDIETLPIEAKIWGTFKQTVQPQQIQKDWSIACWSAKWLFSDTVMGEVVTPKEAIERKDESVLGTIWDLINEAHIVIAHNGDEFDLKKLNTRFFLAGYTKPSFYKSVDTLKVARDMFAFTFNKMDWINKLLGIGTKITTSWEWWDEASNGNKKYLDMMLEYNKHDVNILEELYLRMRPWMKGHPNLALYSVNHGVAACPACGSVNLHFDHYYTTALGMYKGFRCEDCGAIGRSTKKQFKVSSAIGQG